MTFKNKNFKTRDYEATNIAACVAEVAPTANYIPCDPSFIANMQSLWLETANGQDVRYYGWL